MLLLGAGILASVRMSFSEEKVKKTLSDVDVKEVTLPNLDGGKELSLVDFLEEASGFNFEKTAGIQKKDLEKFLGKPYVIDMVSDFVGGYVGYFMEGKEPDPFKKKDVLKFVEEHDADLRDLLGFSFVYKNPETGKSQVYDVDINNAFKDLGTDEITPEFLEKETGLTFKYVKLALSMTMLIILGAAALVLIILVLLIHVKTPRSGFSFAGMTMMLSGIVLGGCAGLALAFQGSRNLGSLIIGIVKPLEINMLIVGGGLFVLGLLIYVIARSICKACAKKKLAANE